MIFLFKPIKPAPLKVDALRLQFLTAIHEMQRAVKKDYQAITDTWEHEVVWDGAISLKGGPTMIVGTDDQIFKWLNDGTKPHDIPKGMSKKTLMYQTGFIPKTKPNWIGSQKGGKSGNYVYSKKVHHPGIEARNYEKIMTEKWKPLFKQRMEEAMRRAAKASGHGV